MVGSLIFVWLQIRQGNRLTQAESVQAHVHARNRDVLSPLTEPACAKRLRLGINDFTRLSKDEQIAVHAQLAKMANMGQTQFTMRRDGLIREEYAAAMDALSASLLKSPGVVQWWEMARGNFADDYVSHLEDLRAAFPSPPLTEALSWFSLDAGDASERV